MSAVPPLIPPGIGPLTQTAGTALAVDQSGASWQGSTWWQQLLPASWRGVGFVMDVGQTTTGRRIAIHEYPYRDSIWAEDLGKLPRRFSFQAFLTGDDVYQQRDAMIAACEQPGEGTLVHPTMGSIQCILVDFSTTDRRERGRYVEIAFSFVISTSILFPQTIVATGDNTNSMAAQLDQAAAGDFAAGLTSVQLVPQYAMRALPGFTGLAQTPVDDPARALSAVAGLQGYFSRYSAGRRTTLLPATATVESCLSASIISREAVLAAISGLEAAAGALT
jgi:prophage DNA circulation protein